MSSRSQLPDFSLQALYEIKDYGNMNAYRLTSICVYHRQHPVAGGVSTGCLNASTRQIYLLLADAGYILSRASSTVDVAGVFF